MIHNIKEKMKKSIRTYIGLCLATGCILMTDKVYAGEKEYPFEIDKGYEACKFEIDLDTPGEYTAVVTDPNGNETQCSAIDDTKMTCTIKNAKAGEWKVSISSDAVDDIKAIIHVSTASARETEVVDNNISVGKDIAGIKMYFVDDSFVITWTDENCGNVNIKVVNLDTSETIASQTVADKKFVCDIPASVKNIAVSVVPSTSANISGAALTYTYEVNNHPDADVSFPDIDKTNQDKITATIKLNQPYSTYVTINDEEVDAGKDYQAGTYEVEIPVVQDGANNIKLYIVDSNGNMRSYPFSVIKDTVPPTLEFQEAYDGLTTEESSITIKGNISNYDALSINDVPVTPTTDGHFEYGVTLHEGDNVIQVVASDEAGNQVNYSIIITQTVKERSIDTTVILIVMVVVGIIALIIKKKVSGNKDKAIQESKSEVFDPEKLDLSKEKKISKTEKKKRAVLSEAIKKAGTNKFGDIMKENKKGMKKNKKLNIHSNAVYYMFCFLATVIVFSFVLHVGYISSGSMEHTLLVHDVTVNNRLAYLKHSPKRGDIISFKHDGDIYSKRVVGIAGDTISFVDGYVYINGEKSDEPYIGTDVETNCMKTFEVPEETVFVLGDNREDSYDSRYWDEPYVKCSDIISKYMFSIPFHAIFKS